MKPSLLILAMLAATAARADQTSSRFIPRAELGKFPLRSDCDYTQRGDGLFEQCGTQRATEPHKAWCSEIGKNLYHLCDVVDPPEYQP